LLKASHHLINVWPRKY